MNECRKMGGDRTRLYLGTVRTVQDMYCTGSAACRGGAAESARQHTHVRTSLGTVQRATALLRISFLATL